MRTRSHTRSLSSAGLSRLRKACVVAAAVGSLVAPFWDASAETPPDFQWAGAARGSSFLETMDLAVDSRGNSILTGIVHNDGTLTMGGITLSNGGLFFINFDRGGNVLWATRDGSSQTSHPAMALDGSDNIYVLCSPSWSPGSPATLAGTDVTGTVALVKYGGTGQRN